MSDDDGGGTRPLHPVTLQTGAVFGPYTVVDVLPPFGNIERAVAQNKDGDSFFLFVRQVSRAERAALKAEPSPISTFHARCRRLGPVNENASTASIRSFSYNEDRGAFWVAYEKPRGEALWRFLEGSAWLRQRWGGDTYAIKALAFYEQIAGALQAAADAGFVHGMLSPEWIYVDTTTLDVTVVGAGLQEILDINPPATCRDEWAYRAPETFVNTTTIAADVYSVGQILYEVFGGRRFADVPKTLRLSGESAASALARAGFRPIDGVKPAINELLAALLSPFGLRPSTWNDANEAFCRCSNEVVGAFMLNTPGSDVDAERHGEDLAEEAKKAIAAAKARLEAEQAEADPTEEPRDIATEAHASTGPAQELVESPPAQEPGAEEPPAAQVEAPPASGPAPAPIRKGPSRTPLPSPPPPPLPSMPSSPRAFVWGVIVSAALTTATALAVIALREPAPQPDAAPAVLPQEERPAAEPRPEIPPIVVTVRVEEARPASPPPPARRHGVGRRDDKTGPIPPEPAPIPPDSLYKEPPRRPKASETTLNELIDPRFR